MIRLEFIDGRNSLPRHLTRKFKRRHAWQIAGIVSHHTAGTGSPEAVARYHTGPNHVCSSGCPGALYAFIIWFNVADGKESVEVWWANDLEAVTYSQGGHESPVPGKNPNTNFLGICLAGSFYSRKNKSGTRPHVAQVFAWFALIGHLLGTANAEGFPAELFGALNYLSWSDLYGHFDFGKEACPGDDMRFLVELAKDSREFSIDLPESDREWQQALVNAGHDLGKSGPAKNGVDGDWGQISKRQLVMFQQANGLESTGLRDPATAAALSPFHTR